MFLIIKFINYNCIQRIVVDMGGVTATATTGVLLLALVSMYGCSGTLSARDDRDSYTIDLKGESWELVPVNNTRVESLRDIRDGVYSIELASVRPQCDLGRGASVRYW